MKELSKEFFYLNKGYFSHICKECEKQNSKMYKQNNSEKVKKWHNQYIQDNRDDLLKYSKQYYQENKEELKQEQKKYYTQNKSEILESKKIYYEENKNNILEYKSEYGKNNRDQINEHRRNKIKNDVSFMLRCSVAPKIRNVLKKTGSSKNSNSVWKFLPYSPQELRNHLENQFEPWMSWNNYGAYNKLIWKDDNSSTWVWNIDHIIPQSDLPYASMTDDNFEKCWSLDNLRPYSAKQNIIDGNRRNI